MVELPERHLRTNVLTHRHQCDAQNSEGLEGIVDLHILFLLALGLAFFLFLLFLLLA